MCKEEIYQSFKNSPNVESFAQCIEYCFSHEYIPGDKVDEFLFAMTTKHLMKFRANHFTEEEAKFIINFFSRRYALLSGIKQNVTIKILNEEEYEEHKKEYNSNGSADCIRNNDLHTLYYSPRVVEKLCSGDLNVFLRGMQMIPHEVAHAVQNNVIYKNGIHCGLLSPRLSIYVQAYESITRRVDPEFYDNNYAKLYKENHAEIVGLKAAMEFLKTFAPDLYKKYNQDAINRRIEKYEEALTSSLNVFGDNASHLRSMDNAVCFYVKKHPEVLDEMPILQVSFNKDGNKKSITELLTDRRSRLKEFNESSEDNTGRIEKLNKLYEALCIDQNVMAGGQQGTKAQLKELVDYALHNKLYEFEYKILEQKLSHKDIPEELRGEILSWAMKNIIPDDDPPPMGMKAGH